MLVIGHVWPEPKTTAAGNRMMQLLEGFLAFDYDITFASTATKTEFSATLSDLGIKEVGILLNDASFDGFVSQLKPEVVIFDRFMVEEQFGWRVAQICPDSLLILNTEDLHSLRESRQLCFKKGEEWSILKWLQQDKTKRELASIFRSDLTLVVSTYERELLKEVTGVRAELLLHLPFLLDKVSESLINQFPKFKERKDFISFGNGKHAPNIDSFHYLIEEIWPTIKKKLPQSNLHIYGAYLPKMVQQLHNPAQGLLIHGWTHNLNQVIQKSRIVLAPLRFGAGIKGKLIDAMQNGTPSITTNIGVEGMGDFKLWPGKIANNPQNFAKEAVDLCNNENDWLQAQKNGIELINEHYNKEFLMERLMTRIEGIKESLVDHRSYNVIGTMLQHQTMAAAKYMGKWIEEKNRKN
nr:glycosyltransferase [Croceivirga thetidis]